jgi:RHS repeat-associated protein
VTTNGNTQTRTHNAQNEITGISGAVTPTYDANGNLTRDETGRQFVYDAWNRLVAVKDAAGNTLKSYAYDGLHRRIQETASGTTTDMYYSAAWQVLEERVRSDSPLPPGEGPGVRAQYVWSPVYVDALVLRDRDTNGDGTLDERLWVVQDANYNVTALFDNSGSVVERYVYDPFGQVTTLDAGWTERSSGSQFAWLYLHQGGRFDSVSGLYHFRHRDYSPTLGRWISLDPIRYEAGDVNLYRFVFNAPTVFTDPSGQIAWVPIIVAVVIIAGASGGTTGYVTGSGPSTVESFIPGWGAARSAGAHFSQGNYWAGSGYTALAVSDVFLVRSVATNLCRVGWQGVFSPGVMSVYSHGSMRDYVLRGGRYHRWWSLGPRSSYAYYHAAADRYGRFGDVGRIVVLDFDKAMVYDRMRRWPVLNIRLAGEGRVGLPATNCWTASVTAWSAGNYHLVPYVGLHGPATIWLPENQNIDAGQAQGLLSPPNPAPLFGFVVLDRFEGQGGLIRMQLQLPVDDDPEPYVDPVSPSRASLLRWQAWRARNQR